jgi:hypothetical protein
MASKGTIARRLVALAVLAGAEFAVALPVSLALSTPASAQLFPFFDDRPRRPAPPGFQLFSPFQTAPVPQEAPRAPPVDYSKAPPPRKVETPPTSTVVVMGDSMADWLAYGLEDAFTDTPEIGILRKHRTYSGLIRYDARSDQDWPRVARDILAAEKPGAVVMMLGLNDRQAIRERAPVRGAAPPSAPSPDQQTQDPDNPELQIMAPEPSRPGNFEFRSERWNELYNKRIDDMIAALKSKGVPVIWVGLPPVRGPKSMADTSYLNDLYRARAEKAGIIYVDVWDGFVDESGKFAPQGPDVEGQIRRLRTGDGVHFTKAGARKLAHYVEREIRRVMSTRPVPVALPSDEPAQAPSATLRPGIPATRPLAGAVVPLTANASAPASDELLGGGGARLTTADPVAARVLVKGEPIAPPKGRADEFIWPPRASPVAVQSAPQSNPQAAAAPVPNSTAAQSVQDRDAGKKNAATGKQSSQAEQSAQQAVRNRPAASQQKPKPPASASRDVPRPPASVGSSASAPFGWMR